MKGFGSEKSSFWYLIFVRYIWLVQWRGGGPEKLLTRPHTGDKTTIFGADVGVRR